MRELKDLKAGDWIVGKRGLRQRRVNGTRTNVMKIAKVTAKLILTNATHSNAEGFSRETGRCQTRSAFYETIRPATEDEVAEHLKQIKREDSTAKRRATIENKRRSRPEFLLASRIVYLADSEPTRFESLSVEQLNSILRWLGEPDQEQSRCSTSPPAEAPTAESPDHALSKK